jgi:hypothetical protein
MYGNADRGYMSVRRQRNLEQAPPEYYAATLKTTCDAQGNFRFERVPAGDFYVVTIVRWGVPSGGITLPQGGALMRRISVAPGQSVSVLLSS